MTSKVSLSRGVTLWATQDYQMAIAEAKKYVIKYGLVGKVKVIRHEGQLLIITTQPIILEEVNVGSSCG
jgi:hypothetical protein